MLKTKMLPSCVTLRYGTMTIRSSKMIGFTTRTKMRRGFGCCTTSSCWSGLRFDNCEAYELEPAAFNGWLAGRVTTCSEGGLAASRLCSEGYEFDADPDGEAREGDKVDGEETLELELVAETNITEQTAIIAEKTIFCKIKSNWDNISTLA